MLPACTVGRASPLSVTSFSEKARSSPRLGQESVCIAWRSVCRAGTEGLLQTVRLLHDWSPVCRSLWAPGLQQLPRSLPGGGRQGTTLGGQCAASLHLRAGPRPVAGQVCGAEPSACTRQRLSTGKEKRPPAPRPPSGSVAGQRIARVTPREESSLMSGLGNCTFKLTELLLSSPHSSPRGGWGVCH